MSKKSSVKKIVRKYLIHEIEDNLSNEQLEKLFPNAYDEFLHFVHVELMGIDNESLIDIANEYNIDIRYCYKRNLK